MLHYFYDADFCQHRAYGARARSENADSVSSKVKGEDDAARSE